MGIRLRLGSKSVDLAVGVTPTADEGVWTNIGYVTDGVSGTFGRSVGNGPKSLRVLLPSAEVVNGATVVGWFETIGGTWTVYVQYWSGSVWITVASYSGPGNSSIGNVVSFSPVTASLWRFRVTYSVSVVSAVSVNTFGLHNPGYPATGEMESTVVANPVGSFTKIRMNAVTRTTVDVNGSPAAEAGAVRTFVSPDNGGSWFLLLIGDEITPSPTGNQLKYKVAIDSDANGDFSPDVSFVEIAYST